MSNPFLSLQYEPALENLGPDYYDIVAAATFPEHHLRWRNDALLPILGLDPHQVRDEDFVEAFGYFQGVRPFLALRYHGHQIAGYAQSYNPELGDGRGFLYGQVRGTDGYLYDFGTKGSGQTPYSRRGDGRLTLKGGVREVLAAEALQGLGVTTSRCLSLVETGEGLWRGDEPSPTRSSVMVRCSRSHIRFGTFERLGYLKQPELVLKLLDHVIHLYYPHLAQAGDRHSLFYAELVQRVAKLVAQWMAAGFCHGVLNTDNMSITGESFDYGPYGFISTYNPRFIAAYFDYEGLYCFGNQPLICRSNLELLQRPLSLVINRQDLETSLAAFDQSFARYYRELILNKLGLDPGLALEELGQNLVRKTLECLLTSELEYHQFFRDLAVNFNTGWQAEPSVILENQTLNQGDWETWRSLYHQALGQADPAMVSQQLKQANPATALLRPAIEAVWEAIDQEDNWQPFQDLVKKLQTGH